MKDKNKNDYNKTRFFNIKNKEESYYDTKTSIGVCKRKWGKGR